MQQILGTVLAVVVVGLVLRALGTRTEPESSSSAGGGRFVTGEDGFRYWSPRELPRLRTLLGRLRSTPRSDMERVWIVTNEGGLESALARAKAIQAQGYYAVVTDNLLDARAALRQLSGLTQAEVPAVLAQEHQPEHGPIVRSAVLPPLG
jgi:hypothetical protein